MTWIINAFRYVSAAVTYYQRQIPGSVYLNETGSRQAQVPGGAYVDGA